jgi:hypothetical protein
MVPLPMEQMERHLQVRIHSTLQYSSHTIEGHLFMLPLAPITVPPRDGTLLCHNRHDFTLLAGTPAGTPSPFGGEQGAVIWVQYMKFLRRTGQVPQARQV